MKEFVLEARKPEQPFLDFAKLLSDLSPEQLALMKSNDPNLERYQHLVFQMRAYEWEVLTQIA